jgi:HlyD family secretion protein
MGVSRRKQRKWWSLPLTLAIIVVVGVAAFFGYRYVQAKNQTGLPSNLTTVRVTQGTLQATIGASGNVYTNQSATLNWQTPGVVGQVNVKVGDHVTKGEVLATLDPTSLTNPTAMNAEQNLAAAQQAYQNLMQSTTTLAQAQLTLAQAQQAVTDAQNARAVLNYSRGANGNADAAQAEYYLAVDAYNKALARFQNVQNLSPSDPTYASAQAAVVAAQKTMQSRQATLNWYLSGPTANDIAQADANLALAQAKLADAQRAYDQVKNGPSASDIATAQANIDSAKAAVNMQYIIAPFDGTVTELDSKAGDLVSSSTTALRIDDLSKYFVDLTVNEIDIPNVQVGQKVDITFDAIANKTYNGTVYSIDQIGTQSSGAVNYTVTVQLTNPDPSILPGMTASASVVLNQADNVLMVPSRGIRTQNGAYYMIVLVNGALEQVSVKLGLSNDTESQIISNQVQAGMEVVTNPLSQLTNSSGQLNLGVRLPGISGGGNFGGGNFGGGNFGGGNRTGGNGGSGTNRTGGSGGTSGGSTGGGN